MQNEVISRQYQNSFRFDLASLLLVVVSSYPNPPVVGT